MLIVPYSFAAPRHRHVRIVSRRETMRSGTHADRHRGLAMRRRRHGHGAFVIGAWFALAVSLIGMSGTAATTDPVDPQALFARAEKEANIGIARKTKLVDARPAVPGEVIVTIIAGEGKETESKPAEAGDMVVRNRCPQTGNEQYLVAAAKFEERYGEPLGPVDADGWRPFRPTGNDMLYVIVRSEDGNFTFIAPWGEAMVARPGDAIVRDPNDPKDTYRVAAASFACTYEIVRPAGQAG